MDEVRLSLRLGSCGVRRTLAAAIVLVAATGCGATPVEPQPVSFPSIPLQSVESAGGHLHVGVWSSPQPPAQGNSAFRYVVTDDSGKPVDGLDVAVQPWMPDMDHGTGVTPSIQPMGAGVYELTNVYLFMPGRWQLRTTFTGAVTDAATPDFQVP